MHVPVHVIYIKYFTRHIDDAFLNLYIQQKKKQNKIGGFKFHLIIFFSNFMGTCLKILKKI